MLWEIDERLALCIEAKTDKGGDSEYNKKEIGQLNDHVQWVKDNKNIDKIIPIFVGPLSGATSSANPPDTIKVVKLEEFKKLSEKLSTALEDIANNSLPITLRPKIIEIFKERRLAYPECIEDIDMKDLCGL